MSIDGTYGRLSAHNQRFKELRRKKLKRREDKLWRNSMTHIARDSNGTEKYLKSISPEKLEKLKIEIRKKAMSELRKELYLYCCTLIVISLLVFFIFFY